MLDEIILNVTNCAHVASVLLTWSAILKIGIFSFISFIIYTQFLYIYFSPLKYLPSTPFMPIFGSIFEQMHYETGEFCMHWMNNLKCSVFRYYWLYGDERVMVCDADVAKSIFVTKSNIYQKSKPAYMLVKSLLGNGLITSEGELHSRNRRICNPSFKLSILNKIIPQFEKAGKELTEMWLKEINKMQCKNDSEVYINIPINSELINLTLDVIGKFAFDYEFNAIQHCSSEITSNFRKILGEFKLSWLTILCAIFPILRKIQGRFMDGYETQVEKVNELVYSMIKKKRHEMEMSDEETDVTNLLGNLLKAKDADNQSILNDKQLRDEVVTFMLAGHETTGIGMTWVLHQLSIHPEIQVKVREEVRSIISLNEESLTPEYLEKMTYLTCVIKETLRLFPPVPMIMRQATEDNYIEGYYFPKGTNVNISIASLHRNPKYWEDPLVFCPERFDESNTIYPYSFLPFIGGSRMCIGYKFALMEMKTVLALLVNKFEFLPLPDVTYRKVMSVIMRSEPPIVLKVKIAD